MFAIQIVLLTIRLLSEFSNRLYLGKLIKVIKLMLMEIYKFATIFLIIMIGFLFGIWLIIASNICYTDPDDASDADECDNFSVDTIPHGLRYIFEVFIGTGDLSGVAEQGYAIVFMVVATFFGSLILTNLLIALMTTEYENVQEAAKQEVVYNKAELAFDLSDRSRFMPPPLNILVLIFVTIVDILNFFIAFIISPKYANIYSYIDHQLFINMINFNIFQFEHDKWNPVYGVKYKYKTRKDLLKWYFSSWWFNWFKKLIKSKEENKNKNKNKNIKKKKNKT